MGLTKSAAYRGTEIAKADPFHLWLVRRTAGRPLVGTEEFLGDKQVSIKRPTEQDLLYGLDARGAHADERAEPLPHELSPLERLKGTVKRYDHPTDPVWDEPVGSAERTGPDFTNASLEFDAIPAGLFDNPKAFIEAVRTGISGAWLASAVNASGNIDLFASALQLSAAEVKLLFNKQHLDSHTSEIILDVISLLRRCVSVWESSAQAMRWLHLPVTALGGVEPARLIDTFEGRRWISQVLTKIEQGQFS